MHTDQQTHMDAPFTLTKLTEALKNKSTGKSSIKVYLRYKDITLPVLVAAYNMTYQDVSQLIL